MKIKKNLILWTVYMLWNAVVWVTTYFGLLKFTDYLDEKFDD